MNFVSLFLPYVPTRGFGILPPFGATDFFVVYAITASVVRHSSAVYGIFSSERTGSFKLMLPICETSFLLVLVF
jgi:hypothetical protein